MSFHAMLLVGSAVLHAYVFWRAAAVPWVARRLGPWGTAGVAVLLWAASQVARTLAHDATGSLAAATELVAMDWLATLLLLATALLTVDLVTLFGRLAPSLAPRLRGWALVAGAAAAAVALVQGTRAPVVSEHEVMLRGLPRDADGLVVVAASDLHLGAQIGTRWLADLVARIETAAPDVVVLLGDVVEGHGADPAAVLPELRRLAAPLGVWAVLGNHDRAGGGELLAEAGFKVLTGGWAEIRPGLALAGVAARSPRGREGAVADALRGRPPGALVLLSHYPVGAERAAAAGVSLMLSGHTHGGQVWPLGLLVSRQYPLLAGRYELDGMPVIVSRGAGTWGPRMRLWRPGEILRITLRPVPPQASR